MTSVNNKYNPSPLSDENNPDNVRTQSDSEDLSSISIFKVSANRIGQKSVIFSFMCLFDTNGDGSIDNEEFKNLENSYNEELKKGSSNSKSSGMTLTDFYNRVLYWVQNGLDNNVYIEGKAVNPDGKIDESHQQKIGDCWLLSCINSLSHTKFGKEALDAAIIRRDGEYGLKINGKEYVFSTEELQAAIDSGRYSSGDPDLVVCELAFTKYFDEMLKDPNNYNEIYYADPEAAEKIIQDENYLSIQGGKHSKLAFLKDELKDVTKLLTGGTEQSVSNKSSFEELLQLKADNNDDISLTFSSKYAITFDNGNPKIEKMDPNKNFGECSHAYELKGIEKDSDGKIIKIIVTNPWNNNEDIALTEEEFLRVCSAMTLGAVDDNNLFAISEIKDRYANLALANAGKQQKH